MLCRVEKGPLVSLVYLVIREIKVSRELMGLLEPLECPARQELSCTQRYAVNRNWIGWLQLLAIIWFCQSQGTIRNLGNGGKGPVNQLPGPFPLPVGQPGISGPRGSEGSRGEYVSVIANRLFNIMSEGSNLKVMWRIISGSTVCFNTMIWHYFKLQKFQLKEILLYYFLKLDLISYLTNLFLDNRNNAKYCNIGIKTYYICHHHDP